jgi:hypothetical protein
MSRQCGILNSSQPYRHPRPVNGDSSTFYLFFFLLTTLVAWKHLTERHACLRTVCIKAEFEPRSSCSPHGIATTQTCSDPLRNLSHMACQSQGDPVFGRHKQRISTPMPTISKQHWSASAFQIRNILSDTVTDRLVLCLLKSTVVMLARADIQMLVICEY